MLRGNGVETECSGWCEAVSMSGMPPAYTKFKIENVSAALPDGNYEMFANGNAIRLRLTGGIWLGQS
jgi:hypothetical protein